MASESRNAAPQGVVLLLLLLCVLPSISSAVSPARVDELTLYVHENRVAGPNATLITVLTPSGNLSQVRFGSIQVFSNTLRVGPESTSAVMGVEPGFVVIGTQNIFLSYVFTIASPTYNGTISVQGQFGLNVWPREFAVVGGTGSFRFASGYDISSIVDDSDPADYVTIHKIYLKYVR